MHQMVEYILGGAMIAAGSAEPDTGGALLWSA